MKITEVRKMSTTELTTTSTKMREELAELRRRSHLGEINNVRAIRLKRKDLARVLTVLSEELIKETR
ncbi:MAG: 50S ribosomal protein L29 [Candidatus Saccharibacteria bacterium]